MKRLPDEADDDLPLVDPGRPMVLRLLGLLGAAAFVMLGLSSIVLPLMQPTSPLQPQPRPLPEQRQGPVG